MIFKSITCIECGEHKPRKDRAPAYKVGSVCSWKCDIAQHIKRDKDICLTDRRIKRAVDQMGDDYWKLDSIMFDICITYRASIELAADQWWGVTVDGEWMFDGDGSYSFDEDGSAYDKIDGFLLGDEQTIGERKFKIHAEPDDINAGMIRVLAKCVTKTQEFRVACEKWEQEHIIEIRTAALVEMERMKIEYARHPDISDMPQQEYDRHMKRLDGYV